MFCRCSFGGLTATIMVLAAAATVASGCADVVDPDESNRPHSPVVKWDPVEQEGEAFLTLYSDGAFCIQDGTFRVWPTNKPGELVCEETALPDADGFIEFETCAVEPGTYGYSITVTNTVDCPWACANAGGEFTAEATEQVTLVPPAYDTTIYCDNAGESLLSQVAALAVTEVGGATQTVYISETDLDPLLVRAPGSTLIEVEAASTIGEPVEVAFELEGAFLSDDTAVPFSAPGQYGILQDNLDWTGSVIVSTDIDDTVFRTVATANDGISEAIQDLDAVPLPATTGVIEPNRLEMGVPMSIDMSDPTAPSHTGGVDTYTIDVVVQDGMTGHERVLEFEVTDPTATYEIRLSPSVAGDITLNQLFVLWAPHRLAKTNDTLAMGDADTPAVLSQPDAGTYFVVLEAVGTQVEIEVLVEEL